MKRKIVLTTLAALLSGTVIAQNAAPVTSPAPAVQPSAAAAPKSPNEPRQPYSFLGVETSSVPRIVCEQLGLPRGFGLVVDYVVPDSAAAKAGMQVDDIIRLVNDQMIVGSDQLGKLIRSYPIGTTVTLTILRKNQEMKLPVVLQKHESKHERGDWGWENDWRFEDLPRVEDMHLPDMSAVREAVERAKENIAEASADARKAMHNFHITTTDDGGERSTHIDLGKAQIVYSDDKGELKLETVDGKKMLTAKDAAGKVLFHGPVDSAADRDRMPADVRERFNNLQHENIAPVPPNAPVAPVPPRAPEPNDSVQASVGKLRAVQCTPNERTGWSRNTILL